MKKIILGLFMSTSLLMVGIDKVEAKGLYETETGLNPIVEAKRIELIDKAKEIGIEIYTYEAYRSIQRQEWLFHNGNGVTQVRGGYSYHNWGLAFDLVFKNSLGEWAWEQSDQNNNGIDDWVEVGELGESIGLSWGGRWEDIVDCPHFELTFDLTPEELLSGKKPPTELVEEREEEVKKEGKVKEELKLISIESHIYSLLPVLLLTDLKINEELVNVPTSLKKKDDVLRVKDRYKQLNKNKKEDVYRFKGLYETGKISGEGF